MYFVGTRAPCPVFFEKFFRYIEKSRIAVDAF